MKYISTLIFALALAYSWKLVHQNKPINFETHASIQLKLVDVIKQSILQAKPLAKNIEIIKISTEPINDMSVKAYFSYKFQEPDADSNELTEQAIEGEAILTRKNGVDPKEDHWSIEKVTTKNGAMIFKNGLEISPIAVPGEESITTEPTKTIEPSATPTTVPVNEKTHD